MKDSSAAAPSAQPKESEMDRAIRAGCVAADIHLTCEYPKAGLVWGAMAELTAVYLDLGVSPGMSLGIDRAYREGRPVAYRRLAGWKG